MRRASAVSGAGRRPQGHVRSADGATIAACHVPEIALAEGELLSMVLEGVLHCCTVLASSMVSRSNHTHRSGLSLQDSSKVGSRTTNMASRPSWVTRFSVMSGCRLTVCTAAMICEWVFRSSNVLNLVVQLRQFFDLPSG